MMRYTTSGSRLLVIAGLAALASCHDGLTDPMAERGDRIVIHARALTLATGDTTQLGFFWIRNGSVTEATGPTGENRPFTATPRTTLRSSDTTVATFGTGGLVTARAPGTAWVVVQRGDARDSSRVTVLASLMPATGIIGLTTGVGHTCALQETGVVWCWGSLWNAPTGTGARVRYSSLVTPTAIATTERFVQIGAGTDHTCAQTQGGAVYCWGDNRFGQLGTSNQIEPAPRRVAGISTAQALGVGGDMACAVLANGAVQCWGQNVDRLREHRSGTGEAFTAVAVGSGHTCALTTAGSVWCWGANEAGQLGTGDIRARTSPQLVALEPKVSRITAASSHTCALDVSGTAWCWGSGSSGESGPGASAQRLMPVAVAAPVRFTQLATGGGSTCAIDSNSHAWCWGSNLNGSLGIGRPAKADPMMQDFIVPTPTRVVTTSTYDRISTGGATCAIDATEGRLECWGLNRTGQLGIGRLGWAPGRRYSQRDFPTAVVRFAP